MLCHTNLACVAGGFLRAAKIRETKEKPKPFNYFVGGVNPILVR
jgi:hypothetical protein